MNTYLLFITVVILFCNSLAYAVSTEENVNNNKFGLAKIEVLINNKPTRYGTGFFFYKDNNNTASYILTANHVVKDEVDEAVNAIKVSYLTSPKNIFVDCEAEKISSDEEHDLALLKVSCIPEHFFKLGDAISIPLGKRLDVIGWGEGVRPDPAVYVTENVKSLRKDGKTVLSIANITHGDSGAPALNDKGEVIAIVTMGEIVTKTTSAVPINLAFNLCTIARQSEEKARYEELYDKVKKHEVLIEQLKQNIQFTADWTRRANPVEGGPEVIPLIIFFAKAFDDQYLPIEVKVNVVPSWRVTSKDEKESLLFSSVNMHLDYEIPPIVISETVAKQIQESGYLFVKEMYGWITAKLGAHFQESTQTLKIDSVSGTIELTIPSSGKLKSYTKPPKPFYLGER